MFFNSEELSSVCKKVEWKHLLKDDQKKLKESIVHGYETGCLNITPKDMVISILYMFLIAAL